MRKLLGKEYEKNLLFSVQHLWVFSNEQSIRQLAVKSGYSQIEVRFFQRYSIENMLGWCIHKRPRSDVDIEAFKGEMDAAWRSTLSTRQLADYIVLYAYK